MIKDNSATSKVDLFVTKRLKCSTKLFAFVILCSLFFYKTSKIYIFLYSSTTLSINQSIRSRDYKPIKNYTEEAKNFPEMPGTVLNFRQFLIVSKTENMQQFLIYYYSLVLIPQKLLETR